MDDGGELISECSCRGTSGHVHEACLLDWFRTRGNWSDLACPQCKHEFYGQTGVNLASLALSKVQHVHVASFLSFRNKSIVYAAALKTVTMTRMFGTTLTSTPIRAG